MTEKNAYFLRKFFIADYTRLIVGVRACHLPGIRRQGRFAEAERLNGFHPCVAVPARDKETRLPRLLASLAAQGWQRESGWRLPVVLALNNCRDRSAAVVEAARPSFPELRLIVLQAEFEAPHAGAGAGRRLAMDAAARLLAGRGSGVILTTDADATPPSDWVAANLAAIGQGADLVGGRLIGDRAEETRLGPDFARRAAAYKRFRGLRDHLEALLDPIIWDPEPRHWDHTGASLAVRADVYAAVGGLNGLPTGEDVDFVERCLAAGFRLRHAPEVAVEVSARTQGRASGGMASCIAGWLRDEAAGAPFLVEDPETVAGRIGARIAERERGGRADAWPTNPIGDAPGAPGPGAALPVAEAIAILHAMIARIEGQRHAA